MASSQSCLDSMSSRTFDCNSEDNAPNTESSKTSAKLASWLYGSATTSTVSSVASSTPSGKSSRVDGNSISKLFSSGMISPPAPIAFSTMPAISRSAIMKSSLFFFYLEPVYQKTYF